MLNQNVWLKTKPLTGEEADSAGMRQNILKGVF